MKLKLRTLIAALLLVGLCAPLATAAEPGIVDINTAGIDELSSLPRIGPKVAVRIIDYRDENGPFEKIEELMNVRGVGAKTFDRLKDQITVSVPEEQDVKETSKKNKKKK